MNFSQKAQTEGHYVGMQPEPCKLLHDIVFSSVLFDGSLQVIVHSDPVPRFSVHLVHSQLPRFISMRSSEKTKERQKWKEEPGSCSKNRQSEPLSQHF